MSEMRDMMTMFQEKSESNSIVLICKSKTVLYSLNLFLILHRYYNADVLLSASPDINDLVLISKYFKRQNVMYKIFKKTQWIECVEIFGDKFELDWVLGGRRNLRFKMTDIRTEDTKKPWSKFKENSMHYV